MKLIKIPGNNYSTIKKKINIKRIKSSIIKIQHCKTSKLLNDSAVSKIVIKNGLKYMIYLVINILLTKIKGLKPHF